MDSQKKKLISHSYTVDLFLKYKLFVKTSDESFKKLFKCLLW